MNKEKNENLKKLLIDISILNKNKVPLDVKGNKINILKFEIENEEYLEALLNAMERNTTFTGSLTIISTKFKEIFGVKIVKIIKNNCISSLTIWNRNLPFSDRIAVQIGEALSTNTTLINLNIFLNVENISPIYLLKFLENYNSKLESISFLKIGTKLFNCFSEFLNKKSHLKKVIFFFEPLKEVNLLYEKEISDECLRNLADKIQNCSNITETSVISLEEKYEEDINEKLLNDINTINQTLKFACEIIKKEKEDEIFTEKEFKNQNQFIDNIIETLDREEGKKKKNSIVSVRSYLDRAIGELLNQALYDLDIQRETYPEKKDLFTAKGSIKFVAQYLLDNKH